MVSVSQMIRSVAHKKKVQQYIVEKDYALSYLLAAIVQVNDLGENLVLKGGTALKKLYFANYRFSEDLDYSLCSGCTSGRGNFAPGAIFNLVDMGVILRRLTNGQSQEALTNAM